MCNLFRAATTFNIKSSIKYIQSKFIIKRADRLLGARTAISFPLSPMNITKRLFCMHRLQVIFTLLHHYTLSSWNHHLVSLGDLPFLQFFTYRSLSAGRCFTVELDSMDRMLIHTELTVMAGDQESYRISRQICPLL
uniref:Ubiquitin-conjugating enzyme n=1 Tax=Pistacia terebinthus subsp. palaestina TaxID=434239 RepID=A0A8F2ZG63_9ROSI|nr:ubiquitin-conjugating enzyme [Pistacia terebinthus subsp. palaestina]